MGEEMIYICIERDLARENNFKILPKHPLSLADYELYDYDEGFDLIDWETLTKTGLKDGDAKQIKMAECLSDRVIPVEYFKCFYVSSEEVKMQVESMLRTYGVNFPPPHVNKMSKWFS